MNRITLSCVLLASCASIVFTGCMPKMTIEDMKAMMPQRPPELDQLKAFAGRWEYTGEAKMAGLDRLLKISGHGEAKWEGDGRYLVSHEVMSMEEFDEMRGMATWTYDAHSKKFRSTWVDSMGTIAIGTARHDERTNTWYMRSTSYGPFGKTLAKGRVEFTDPDTAVWRWTEYAMGGLVKTMEMTGTSKRK